MKKKCDIIMLPTDKVSKILIEDRVLKFNPSGIEVGGNVKYQHIYILSDEDIKEGDWVMFYNSPSKVLEVNNTHAKIETKSKINELDLESIKRMVGNTTLKVGDDTKMTHSFSIKQLPKIIASTDTLLQRKEIIDRDEIGNIYNNTYLPRPSNEFLQKYCELGGVYEVFVDCYDIDVVDENTGYVIEKPIKVASDNTIIIHLIKDSWNREEVRALLIRLHEQSPDRWELNNWIQENL